MNPTKAASIEHPESEKLIHRLHQVNESLAGLNGDLREITNHILGTPPPSPVEESEKVKGYANDGLLTEVHMQIDKMESYIRDISNNVSRLSKI